MNFQQKFVRYRRYWRVFSTSDPSAAHQLSAIFFQSHPNRFIFRPIGVRDKASGRPSTSPRCGDEQWRAATEILPSPFGVRRLDGSPGILYTVERLVVLSRRYIVQVVFRKLRMAATPRKTNYTAANISFFVLTLWTTDG